MRQILFISLIFLLNSCVEEKTNSIPEEDITEIIELKYAEGFQISQLGPDFYQLRLLDPEGNQTGIFHLGSKNHSGFQNENIPFITYPIERVACQSTTHTSFFSFLDQGEIIKGVAYAHLLKNPYYLNRMDAGELKNLSTGEEIDFEILLSLNPDILLTYPYGDTNFEKVINSGIPCLSISEYREKTPLGQAEWIKVFGLLLGDLEGATREFDALEQRYSTIISKGESIKADGYPPTVFTGSYWKGNWKAPSGNSLIAQYLKDAGTKYVFDNLKEEGNIELDFEEFYPKAFEADYFGKVVYEGDIINKDMLIDQDDRLKEIKSYKNDQIFYCNAGTKDYFGEAIMHPDIILNDLVTLFWEPENQKNNTYFFLAE